MDPKNLSSNWKKLQATLQKNESGINTSSAASQQNGLKRKRSVLTKDTPISKRNKQDSSSDKPKRHRRTMSSHHKEDVQDAKNFVLQKDIHKDNDTTKKNDNQLGDRINEGLCSKVDIGKYVALDCEMVGIGPDPSRESALARVSIVNYNGEQVYDSFVKPQETVTDWRTHVSGIAPKHMVYARSLEEVQHAVASIIKDRVVVGHSIRGDFDVLLLSHPRKDIRDTARHAPYRKLAGGGSPKLKILASELLGLDIQAGEHSSIEDARATMLLFRRDKEAFDKEHGKKWPTRNVVIRETAEQDNQAGTTQRKPKKKKKKKK